ncbi:uncharacterized protein LOC112968660 isoform X2 [Apteryx rowi]|uniref:uncharacterized protein LOC112968660 isoform X2 n=1 Tax=Apteryx rowi TaxID=308060 RepID=UPI000E1DC509|nr:uncharacterized protein LOC112968660 isoform X2 [Apteryx rowi]
MMLSNWQLLTNRIQAISWMRSCESWRESWAPAPEGETLHAWRELLYAGDTMGALTCRIRVRTCRKQRRAALKRSPHLPKASDPEFVVCHFPGFLGPARAEWGGLSHPEGFSHRSLMDVAAAVPVLSAPASSVLLLPAWLRAPSSPSGQSFSLLGDSLPLWPTGCTQPRFLVPSTEIPAVAPRQNWTEAWSALGIGNFISRTE